MEEKLRKEHDALIEENRKKEAQKKAESRRPGSSDEDSPSEKDNPPPPPPPKVLYLRPSDVIFPLFLNKSVPRLPNEEFNFETDLLINIVAGERGFISRSGQ